MAAQKPSGWGLAVKVINGAIENWGPWAALKIIITDARLRYLGSLECMEIAIVRQYHGLYVHLLRNRMLVSAQRAADFDTTTIVDWPEYNLATLTIVHLLTYCRDAPQLTLAEFDRFVKEVVWITEDEMESIRNRPQYSAPAAKKVRPQLVRGRHRSPHTVVDEICHEIASAAPNRYPWNMIVSSAHKLALIGDRIPIFDVWVGSCHVYGRNFKIAAFDKKLPERGFGMGIAEAWPIVHIVVFIIVHRMVCCIALEFTDETRMTVDGFWAFVAESERLMQIVMEKRPELAAEFYSHANYFAALHDYFHG